MFLLNDVSIKQRLTSLIMSISTVSVLLTTFTISSIGLYNLRQNMIEELRISASIVGERNSGALVFGDNAAAENNLRVFSVKQSILRACLYDQLGTVFARYQLDDEHARERIDPNCPEDLQPRTLMNNQHLDIMMPVMYRGDKVGTIYVQSDLQEIARYLEKQSTIAVMVTIAVLVLSYLLAIRLQNFISRPILKLADTAREISANKDYTIRANPFDGKSQTGGNNEIRMLTDAFNTMLTEIGARDKQLKQQNVELEKARDVAESANRAKSQFLANISHELRTPLNAIIGFSSILMNQLFGPIGDDKYLEYSKDINESGTHLLDIINDILDLAKAEAGKLELAYEEIYVAKAIQKCVTIMAERAEKGKITIVTDIPKHLPTLVADRLRFIQIVLNILSNAVKFTEEGGKVNIKVSTAMTEGEVSHFIVSIADTGIGMTPEDINKAYQSFGQVDSGLNRKYEGSGLGLPLTKKLLELHHGTLDIESEPGVGTIVTMTFPAMPPEGLAVLS